MKCNFKYIFIACTLTLFLKPIEDTTNHIINITIKQYPTISHNLDNLQAMTLCNILNCNSLIIPSNFGIFSLYAGYMNISDENGQIIFPRKTVKDSLNLLITEKIVPIFMFRNTIAFWKIRDGSNAQIYKIEKKQDKETQLFIWDVKETKIPASKQIPLHTIIIIANPNDIYVPIGITKTTNNPQLILPEIYAKNDLKHIQNSLFVLNIKPFFSQVKKIFKERPLGYLMQII